MDYTHVARSLTAENAEVGLARAVVGGFLALGVGGKTLGVVLGPADQTVVAAGGGAALAALLELADGISWRFDR